ncbi:Uncharacterized protein APZ42_009000 [Daphnia magna]|uniref:Uncharacterized protein n=1 Tax=Daphnia magna TaxID=35525 RepID=A0A164EA12_9CRUS|nr:Uncharacterized protein APZ42_009000 [Daphnia magna]
MVSHRFSIMPTKRANSSPRWCERDKGIACVLVASLSTVITMQPSVKTHTPASDARSWTIMALRPCHLTLSPGTDKKHKTSVLGVCVGTTLDNCMLKKNK